MKEKRIALGVGNAAGLTALVGLINLFSAVTPSSPARAHWLNAFFPFEVRAGAHLFAALSGFFLLVLATNLLWRKRMAWALVVALLVISIASHLLKGLDVEESLLALVLLVQLLAMRDVFTARSDRPSIAQGVRVFCGALLFTLAYGTAGFFFLDLHYQINFNFWQALAQTLAMFFTDDNAGLQPRTRFGSFFANSIYIVGAVTFFSALYFLLRPVLLRGEPANHTERQQARALVERHGRSSLARFALLEDKAYYFSPSGRSVIAYVPKGRGAIALGDPIGEPEDCWEAILGFQVFCRRNDWYPAFYQTHPDFLALYRAAGFKVLKIGEEAIVDLQTFTLKGKAAQNLRTAANRMTKLGYCVRFYDPPLSDTILHHLKAVSDEWLQATKGAEKRFSLGWFEVEYVRGCQIATVETSTNEIIAFANVVPQYQCNSVTLDLMRYRPEIENGTMDFLLTSLFQHFQTRGYENFNLGLSALSGVGESSEAPRLEKGLSYLYEHLNRFYNFKGLHRYKDKFLPNWEPRYWIYPGTVALPEVVVALIRADSGDRWLDYFKPGA